MKLGLTVGSWRVSATPRKKSQGGTLMFFSFFGEKTSFVKAQKKVKGGPLRFYFFRKKRHFLKVKFYSQNMKLGLTVGSGVSKKNVSPWGGEFAVKSVT